MALAVLLHHAQLLAHALRKCEIRHEAETRKSGSLSTRLQNEKERSARLERDMDDTKRLYARREVDYLNMKVQKEAAEQKVSSNDRMESARIFEVNDLKTQAEDAKVTQNLNHPRKMLDRIPPDLLKLSQ